jgi:protein XagA
MIGPTGFGRFLAIALVMLPASADAGAWTLEAGKSAAYFTTTTSRAERAFNGDRNLQRVARYSKSELQVLYEYGLTDAFTVMFSPSLQRVSVAPPFDGIRSGLGYTEAGGRVRLAQYDAWIFAIQTTLRVPGTSDKVNPAAIGYYDTQFDIRGLVGYSFSDGLGPAFIDLQFGNRFRSGGPPNEFRADLTFGVRPHEQLLVLIQSFNVISEGSGTWTIPSYSYYKLQMSAVYPLTSTVSLQLGGFTTYHGRNALQENGVVVGVWFKI